MEETKLAAAVLVFIAGVGGALFARRLEKSKARKEAARFANAFAGGVFLGAAFLHMLPDAIVHFANFLPDAAYPFFALTAAAGFMAILLLDKVAVPAGPAGTAASGRGAVYPYILMLTLSIHSIITGVALGLEDHPIGALAILIAVLAHKSTAAMALAVSFSREHAPASLARNLIGIFCFTTPLGIILGTWWASFLEGPGEARFEGIFDALAAGTFFYIAVVDILAEEFRAKAERWSLFVVALLGFSIMALIAVWT